MNEKIEQLADELVKECEKQEIPINLAIVHNDQIRTEAVGSYDDLLFGFLTLEEILQDGSPVPFEMAKDYVKESYEAKEAGKTQRVSPSLLEAFEKATRGGRNV